MKLFEVLELLGYSKVSLMFRTLEGIDLAPTVRASEIKNEEFLSCKILARRPVVDRSGTLSLCIKVEVED